MTDDEKDRALCEAHCNSAADEYFNARPQLDSGANRRIFYAGHRKAWIERGEAVRLNAQAVPDGMSDYELSELAHCAIQEANSFGIGHDLFLRHFKSLRKRLTTPAAPQPAQPARTALEQYDLEQSGDYRKGYDDGRKKGYEVGYRQATEHAAMKSQPAPQPASVDQNDARDAARWRYIAWHIGVAWNEQGFTSLVRIVSDKHREMLSDMVDRMMAGDWPEAAPQPAQPNSVALAVIGCKHFGNPIPPEWYAAAKELLSASPQPAQPLTDRQAGMCPSPLGCERHGCHGACLPTYEQAHGIGVKND